jgi:hypothetical protein
MRILKDLDCRPQLLEELVTQITPFMDTFEFTYLTLIKQHYDRHCFLRNSTAVDVKLHEDNMCTLLRKLLTRLFHEIAVTHCAAVFNILLSGSDMETQVERVLRRIMHELVVTNCQFVPLYEDSALLSALPVSPVYPCDSASQVATPKAPISCCAPTPPIAICTPKVTQAFVKKIK